MGGLWPSRYAPTAEINEVVQFVKQIILSLLISFVITFAICGGWQPQEIYLLNGPVLSMGVVPETYFAFLFILLSLWYVSKPFSVWIDKNSKRSKLMVILLLVLSSVYLFYGLTRLYLFTELIEWVEQGVEIELIEKLARCLLAFWIQWIVIMWSLIRMVRIPLVSLTRS